MSQGTGLKNFLSPYTRLDADIGRFNPAVVRKKYFNKSV